MFLFRLEAFTVTTPKILIRVLLAGIIAVSPAIVVAGPNAVRELIERAERHEKAGEWDKAYAVYDEIIKSHRGLAGIKDRQLNILRRFWQEQRHADLGYRKEVLSLDYSQALKLHGLIADAILDASMQKAKVRPGQLLRKGIEELEAALADRGFAASYLAEAKPEAIAEFRAFLKAKHVAAAGLNRDDCRKTLRESALAGQSTLRLKPVVSVMELACGACYALDEYTAYLTPQQYRELADSLKSSPMMFVSTVQFDMKAPELGYMRISMFNESTAMEVDEAFAQMNKGGLKGLILDLRGNPGGLFESSVEVARRFLANGVIASTENYDPKQSLVYQSRNPAAWTVPLVVLVDGDTASAAEVLAGALKENNRARLIGQPTFGKGSTQGLIKLPDALGGVPTGGLRLTIARFFSPKGVPYAGQGIVPDLLVERLMDDLQLAEAIAELQRR